MRPRLKRKREVPNVIPVYSDAVPNDGLAIPVYLQFSKEQRQEAWGRAAEVPPSHATQQTVFKSAADVARERRDSKRLQELERATIKHKSVAGTAPEMVLVYRTRYTFIQRARLRKGEKFWTPETLHEIVSPAEPVEIVVAKTKPKPISKLALRRLKLSKSDQQIIELLRRPQGATANEMATATGCKPHSCTSKFARFRRDMEVLINSEIIDGRDRVYRIDA